jgi:GDP-L-fucose synthase
VANSTFPAEFIYNNLMIQNNVIHNAYLTGVQRLLFWAAPASIPSWRLSR